MTDQDSKLDRRTVLKGTGAATALGAGGLVAMSGSGAAASADFSASKVTAASDDGEIQSVFIEPTGQVNWQNFDESIEEVQVTISAKIEGVTSMQQKFQAKFGTGSNAGTDGSWDYSGTHRITLYDGSAADPFEQPDDGTVQKQTVVLKVEVALLDANGNVADPNDEAVFSDTATMNVHIKNRQASAGGNGQANGGVTK